MKRKINLLESKKLMEAKIVEKPYVYFKDPAGGAYSAIKNFIEVPGTRGGMGYEAMTWTGGDSENVVVVSMVTRNGNPAGGAFIKIKNANRDVYDRVLKDLSNLVDGIVSGEIETDRKARSLSMLAVSTDTIKKFNPSVS